MLWDILKPCNFRLQYSLKICYIQDRAEELDYVVYATITEFLPMDQIKKIKNGGLQEVMLACKNLAFQLLFLD